jgi:hypothetical protein
MKSNTVWVILPPFSESDVDIINNLCNSKGVVGMEIIDPTVVGIDSGWCDASTGHRLVTATMKFQLTIDDGKLSTLIRLKFGDRAYIKEEFYDTN